MTQTTEFPWNQPRPHPDPAVEAALQQIDALVNERILGSSSTCPPAVTEAGTANAVPMSESSRTAIEAAWKHLDRDPQLAAYMLRDLPEVAAAGLSDLAWAMVKEYPHKNDVLYLIELLEAAIEGGDHAKRSTEGETVWK